MALLKILARNLLTRPRTDPPPVLEEGRLQVLGERVGSMARHHLGHSLSIRALDTGSCNACELEIHALSNPFYQLESYGIRFVASPRHADVLLVTGPMCANMSEAALRTWNAMPAPKWVVAMGDCACNGGVFGESYACLGGSDSLLQVDLHIPGCPPEPVVLLEGLLTLLETVSRKEES